MRIPDYSIKSVKRNGQNCTAISFKFCAYALMREKPIRASFGCDSESCVWIFLEKDGRGYEFR